MSEPLPVVQPFSIDEFRFNDMRSLSKNSRVNVKSAIGRTIKSVDIPKDLFCDSQTVRREDKRVATIQAIAEGGLRDGKPKAELIAEHLATIRPLQEARHPLEIFNGDWKTLTFGVRRGRDLIGAFQWYGVRTISQTDLLLRVRAGFFPAFPDETIDSVNAICIRMVSFFVRTRLGLGAAKQLEIVQAVAPTIEQDRSDTSGHKRSLDLYRDAQRLGTLRVSFEDDPTQLLRGRMRIVAPGASFIAEPEIDELIRERTGG